MIERRITTLEEKFETKTPYELSESFWALLLKIATDSMNVGLLDTQKAQYDFMSVDLASKLSGGQEQRGEKGTHSVIPRAITPIGEAETMCVCTEPSLPFGSKKGEVSIKG